MTDWWSTAPSRTEGESDPQEWRKQADRDMERIARSGENLAEEPDDWGRDERGPLASLHPEPAPATPEPDPTSPRPDRRKSLLLGAAGAAVAGVLVFAMMPDGSSGVPTGTTASSEAPQGGFLPAAGGGPAEGAQDREEAGVAPASKAPPKTVVLSATPEGSGQVGAIVEVTITNNTENAIIVMSSMVKGDGRPAVLGEGTLAPGSRSIDPGETATGTIEFATKKPPTQIVLMDIGGNVVAASG